jgi:hypothetical protein
MRLPGFTAHGALGLADAMHPKAHYPVSTSSAVIQQQFVSSSAQPLEDHLLRGFLCRAACTCCANGSLSCCDLCGEWCPLTSGQ